MHIYTDLDGITKHLKSEIIRGKAIGFVPTMGALHAGHLSLLKKGLETCELMVVSIFVNPTQFNNPEDLENYPRTIEQDLEMLKKASCDIVFLPDVKTIYPDHYKDIDINISPIDQIMEGKYRPGHFHGVLNVVYRFFEIIQPNKAFFGRKDLQQVAIVKKMVKTLGLPIEVVACDTLRQENGLAMSSRNARLTDKQKEEASAIYKTLVFGKKLAKLYSPAETLTFMLDYFNHFDLKLEYLEIIDSTTFLPLTDYWVSGASACIAAYSGEVRLIDNMELS